jgi:peptidoglycan DL-endopeptidase CwlO
MAARTGTAAAYVGAVALSTFAAACASAGGATPRPFPGATLPRQAPASVAAPPDELPAAAPVAPAPDAPITALVATALEFLGVPYHNGGTTADGFDCSGFTQYVFAQHGLALPREVREQFNAGKPVDLDAVEAGDLIFFETVAKGPSHVGIALGGDAFVHAPSSAGVVRVERYTATYWAKRFVGARRVTSN